MNGKSWSLPLGMVLKKQHCAKCGTQLEKEQTHRVVTPQDPDYFLYHSRGRFPRRDYDVYTYQFRCPGCGAATSYQEQCIIGRIQKKLGYLQLTGAQLKENYESCRKAHHKMVLLKSLLLPLILGAAAWVLSCISQQEGTAPNWQSFAIMSLIGAVVLTLRAIKRIKLSECD